MFFLLIGVGVFFFSFFSLLVGFHNTHGVSVSASQRRLTFVHYFSKLASRSDTKKNKKKSAKRGENGKYNGAHSRVATLIQPSFQKKQNIHSMAVRGFKKNKEGGVKRVVFAKKKEFCKRNYTSFRF